MELDNIVNIVDGQYLTKKIQNINIQYAGAADLMSDILALTDQPMILITGLCGIQVVRTAEMSGNILAIIFVRNKLPTPNIIDEAEHLNIPLIKTKLSMFETCGLLYENNIKPVPLKYD